MNPEKAQELSLELQAALDPLLGAIESLSERIVEDNERIEQIAKQIHLEVTRLKQHLHENKGGKPHRLLRTRSVPQPKESALARRCEIDLQSESLSWREELV